MPAALTKADIAALAVERGRPISGALAGTVLTVTGGCPRTVKVALDAAQRADSDLPVTKVVADAVHSRRAEVLREMSETEHRVVVLSHFGVGSDVEVLRDLLDTSFDITSFAITAVDTTAIDIRGILTAAVDDGLITGSTTPLPDVDRLLADVMGRRRFIACLTTLLEYRCKTDSLDDATAVALARAGLRHPELASHLTAAAHGAAAEPAGALLDCAVSAGADAVALAAERAEISMMLGDLDSAEQFCDSVLEHYDSVDADTLRTAVRVSATVAAERGMAQRSHQLYTWLGPARVGVDTDVALSVALTAGDLGAADAMAASVSAAPPTSSSAAVTLLADGVRQTIDATSTAETAAATSTVMRALSLSGAALSTPGSVAPMRKRGIVPNSAAAVAVLFALHCGDLPRAESTAARAAALLPPRHPDATRIALLQAWSSMLAGDLSEARTRTEALHIPVSHNRNRLWLHALRVGLARRSGDAGSLVNAWEDAQDVIAQYSVDLLSLLPVGELWLGAVRVGQPERIAHLIAQADAIAENLNEPSAWTSALHWYGVQAAILAEHPPALVPHARALAAAAESNHYSAALATAGRAWLAVLQGHPDVAGVETAAQGLARFGLSWDGARLASEAALRVADTRAATTLLQVARSLRTPVAAPSAVTEEPKGSLSAREAEVAELLVLGVTYREAGARLYISAKTVEHHVARIRRRLGAGSRSELLSMLRAMGYGSGAGDT